MYTRQHGLEANLFLAPGEGDKAVAAEEDLAGAAASAGGLPRRSSLLGPVGE